MALINYHQYFQVLHAQHMCLLKQMLYLSINLNSLSKQSELMIGKTLKKIISSEDLRFLGINPTQRPEELSIEKFVKLAETINAI